jgi:hypothetical protein
MAAKARKVQPRSGRALQRGEGISEPATKLLPVPVAGRRFFGLSRNASYAAAARGELPVVRIGRKVWASVPAIERMIAEAGSEAPRERDMSALATTIVRRGTGE